VQLNLELTSVVALMVRHQLYRSKMLHGQPPSGRTVCNRTIQVSVKCSSSNSPAVSACARTRSAREIQLSNDMTLESVVTDRWSALRAGSEGTNSVVPI